MLYNIASISSIAILLSACSCKNISLHDECKKQLNCDTYTIAWGPEISYLDRGKKEKHDVENYMSSIGFNKFTFFVSNENKSIELFNSDKNGSRNNIILCYFRMKDNKWKLYNYNYFCCFKKPVKTGRDPQPIKHDYSFKKYILTEDKI